MLANGKATEITGDLKYIPDCEIIIPGTGSIMTGLPAGMIRFKVLPDITDQKSAEYNSENVIGRSFPILTFSYGTSRSISVTGTFFIIQPPDVDQNVRVLRAVQSAVYPRQGSGALPYYPPPVCKLKCGKLLSKDYLCAVMKSYNVKYDRDVPWDQRTYIPYKMEISMEFEVVYESQRLPNQEQIIKDL